jgi:hypothetical protein
MLLFRCDRFYQQLLADVSDGYNPPDTSIQSELIMGQGFKADGEIAGDIITVREISGDGIAGPTACSYKLFNTTGGFYFNSYLCIQTYRLNYDVTQLFRTYDACVCEGRSPVPR